VKRRALAAGAVAVVVAAVSWLVLREDKARYVHRGTPAFSVLYKDKVVQRDRGPGLLALRVERGRMRGSVVVRPYELPEYEGDVAGVLPIEGEKLIEPGSHLTADKRIRLNTAPGYEVAFTGKGGEERHLILVPPDVEHPRTGVLLSYTLTRPRGRQPLRVRRAAQALRSALGSFEFGTDRL
jgi:hypothetical protein